MHARACLYRNPDRLAQLRKRLDLTEIMPKTFTSGGKKIDHETEYNECENQTKNWH
jgi:hypothetical protein